MNLFSFMNTLKDTNLLNYALFLLYLTDVIRINTPNASPPKHKAEKHWQAQ